MERYAAEAAALREKFKTMDIHRDMPLSPVRPGFGAAGTPCVVKANHFFVGLVDKGIHHYDVRPLLAHSVPPFRCWRPAF